MLTASMPEPEDEAVADLHALDEPVRGVLQGVAGVLVEAATVPDLHGSRGSGGFVVHAGAAGSGIQCVGSICDGGVKSFSASFQEPKNGMFPQGPSSWKASTDWPSRGAVSIDRHLLVSRLAIFLLLLSNRRTPRHVHGRRHVELLDPDG